MYSNTAHPRPVLLRKPPEPPPYDKVSYERFMTCVRWKQRIGSKVKQEIDGKVIIGTLISVALPAPDDDPPTLLYFRDEETREVTKYEESMFHHLLKVLPRTDAQHSKEGRGRPAHGVVDDEED